MSELLCREDPITGIGRIVMSQIKMQAQTALVSNKPVDLVIDHKNSPNPYLSLYGNQWKLVIAKVKHLSSYVCVTDMVSHIIDASQEVMSGTKHEKDWIFYHDALSLMKASELPTG